MYFNKSPVPKQDHQDDRIYYNVVMPYNPINSQNNDSPISPAIFNVEFNQAILDNPSEYYLAVQRFTIPTQTIPIMIAQIQNWPLNVTGPNKMIQSFTLTYGANTSGQVYLDFLTTNPNYPVPAAPSASKPSVDEVPYYYVYNYEQMILMMNNALQTAFNNLPVKPVGSFAPFFIYDTNTELISLVAQIAYYDLANVTPIKIYCNIDTLIYVDNLPLNFLGRNTTNGMDVQLLVRDQKNNYYNPQYLTPPIPIPPAYYIMTQCCHSLTNWNAFRSLQLVSSTLPIRKEYVPRQFYENPSIINTSGILKDFEPILDLGPEARTTVQYQLNSPYQLINMFGSVPLTKLDISIFWTDQQGHQQLLDIAPGQTVSIKLVFIKKSSYEGY